MKTELRIPHPLYAAAVADLIRPHPLAAERVGFFSIALGKLATDHVLLLVNGYTSVPDGQYLDDQWVGARLGSEAIRAALQRVLDTGFGQLHVHLHDHDGIPYPSGTDARAMPPLIKSLAVAGPNCAHGAIVLSRDRAWAQVAAPGSPRLLGASAITVVGFPLRFLQR
ncbi:MAG: hypothetical protein RLZZ15_473 [Verrucomicrobiota bacterium]|jgi:hypothetical protein